MVHPLIRSFCKGLFFTLPIGYTFVDKVGYIASVSGESMQPQLNPEWNKVPNFSRDWVFLSRFAVRNLDVQRGEVVSLISPREPEEPPLVKRIIGLEGDIIPTQGFEKRYVNIPEGHCWVEGDNRRVSKDSNTFGAVSLGLIDAKATYVIWPPSRWQRLEASIPKERLASLERRRIQPEETR